MKRICPALFIVVSIVVVSGCATRPADGNEAEDGTQAAEIELMEPVTSGGKQQAVLSLHKKYVYPDACKFGLTLTNNLPYTITNISFRFAAYTKGDVFYQQIRRNFFEIDSNNREYREIKFTGITCDEISYLAISDPGRCALGDLTRFSSRPGDCIRNVYIASTPYVRLVQK
jgi:hypothetical protein